MDAEKLPLVLDTALQLAGKDTMQAIAKLSNGHWLVTQAEPTTGGLEHLFVSMCSPEGKLEGQMRIFEGGHGSSLAVQEIDGQVFFWCNVNFTRSHQNVGSELCRIAWHDMGEKYLSQGDKRIVPIKNDMTKGWTLVAFDQASNTVGLRRRINPGVEHFEVRHLDEFLEGKDYLLGKTMNFSRTEGPQIQSFAVDGTTLYRLTGESHGTDKPTLRAYALKGKTLELAWIRPLKEFVGYSEFKEPEGLFLYRSGANSTLYVAEDTKDESKAHGRVHLVFKMTDEEKSMRASVSKAWFENIVAYEGYTTWLYFDTHKPPLATTGVGNMIDSGNGLTAWGKGLGWKTKSGQKASTGMIQAEYDRLKKKGIKGSGYAYEAYATLFLDKGVVQWMVDQKRDEFFSTLGRTFPEIDDWPADAQLALMNMAWWMGPNFHKTWPNLTAALKGQNFFKAAQNATSKAKTKRDADDVKLFTNAGRVKAAREKRSVLWGAKNIPEWSPFPGSTNPMPDRLSAGQVRRADPKTKSYQGLITQFMLNDLGYYSLALDGNFGPKSREAYSKFCKANALKDEISVDTLNRLSNQSKTYLKVEA